MGEWKGKKQGIIKLQSSLIKFIHDTVTLSRSSSSLLSAVVPPPRFFFSARSAFCNEIKKISSDDESQRYFDGDCKIGFQDRV